MLEMRHISKVYGVDEAQVFALNDVSLTVTKGEFIAVMGPSGSGKSTAMNILGCLDTPSSGQYLLFGAEVGGMDRDQRALLRRHFLGFIFQGFNLLARTTALENVELPLIYQGVDVEERRERAMEALQKVGLEGRARHRPSELSGGERQRVALARALVNEPACVLADEPTGNLDRETADGVFEQMMQLARERGTAFVVVTHDTQLAARCDRHLHLVKGVLQAAT